MELELELMLLAEATPPSALASLLETAHHIDDSTLLPRTSRSEEGEKKWTKTNVVSLTRVLRGLGEYPIMSASVLRVPSPKKQNKGRQWHDVCASVLCV